MRKMMTLVILAVAAEAFAQAQPPIPNLATYKSKALSSGALACSRFVTQGVNFGTYYDGAWSMGKIAEQVVADGGNPASWYACVDTANDVYRDAYLIPNNGSLPGYNNFATGMRLHYQRTAEVESRKGVAYLAGYHLIDLIGRGAAYCGGGGGTDYITTNPERIRESAYCLRTVLEAQALGVTVTPATKRTVIKNQILSFLDQFIVSKTYRAPTSSTVHPPACLGKWYHQPFMYAIGAYSLIQYTEDTGLDRPAIYSMVKTVADWLWDNARVNGQNVFFYENCKDDPNDPTWNVAMPSGNPASTVDLNLIFPAIYQWLYMTQGSECHNATYRDHADALFSTSVATGMSFLDFDGKHFNQNYTWSREYVRLRSLPEPGCGFPAVPGQPSIAVEVKP